MVRDQPFDMPELVVIVFALGGEPFEQTQFHLCRRLFLIKAARNGGDEATEQMAKNAFRCSKPAGPLFTRCISQRPKDPDSVIRGTRATPQIKTFVQVDLLAIFERKRSARERLDLPGLRIGRLRDGDCQ